MNRYNPTMPPGLSIYFPSTGDLNSALALHTFFDGFSLDSSRRWLWQMFTSLLTSEMTQDWSTIKRSDYCWFYEQLISLLEADYALYEQIRASRIKETTQLTKS